MDICQEHHVFDQFLGIRNTSLDVLFGDGWIFFQNLGKRVTIFQQFKNKMHGDTRSPYAGFAMIDLRINNYAIFLHLSCTFMMDLPVIHPIYIIRL